MATTAVNTFFLAGKPRWLTPSYSQPAYHFGGKHQNRYISQ